MIQVMQNTVHNSPRSLFSLMGKGRMRSTVGAFALVIALVLMAFVFLLMVAMATVLQVEIQQASITANMSKARQNALLGLQVALAQLQEEAGPDKRVTAYADILGDSQFKSDNEAKRYWAGVWNPDGGDGPVWLVSGAPSERVIGGSLPKDNVALVGPASGSQEPRVRVPLVKVLDGESKTTTGYYGYWIGDEGVKAAVTRASPELFTLYDLSDEEYKWQSSGYPRTGLEQITGFEGLGRSMGALSDVVSISQLSLVGGGVAEDVIRNRFFDVTRMSAGVLSDTKSGGLRTDLSRGLESSSSYPGGEIFKGGPKWDLLRDYYNNVRVDPGKAAPVRVSRPDRTTQVNGWSWPGYNNYFGYWNSTHGLFPVLVFAELSFGLKPEGSYGALTLGPVIALANPYDVPLDNATYVVRFHSYNNSQTATGQRSPNVRITFSVRDADGNWVDQPTLTASDGTVSLHINKLLPDYDENDWRGNDLRFEIQTSFAPGEIKWFSLPAGSSTGPYYSTQNPPLLVDGAGFDPNEFIRVEPTSRQDPQIVLPDLPENVRVKMEIPQQARDVILYLKTGNAGSPFVDNPTNPNYNRLQEVSTHISGGGSSPFQPLDSPLAEKLLYQTILLKGTYHTDPNVSREAVKGISLFNVRSSVHKPVEYSQSYNIHFRGAPPHYAGYYGTTSRFDEHNLWERDAIVDPSGPRYSLILFHVPRTGEPLPSIASLQHVDFSRNSYAPTFQVGNSFAHPFIKPGETEGTHNSTRWEDLSWHLNEALWDSFFFSTIEMDADSGGSLKINKFSDNIIVYGNEADPAVIDNLQNPQRAAASLLVDGSFNVNSTSVEAWKTILSGLHLRDITYTDYTKTPSGSESTKPGKAGEVPILNSPYASGEAKDLWRGYPALIGRTPSTGANQLTQLDYLAREIVKEVKRRGPFYSIADFVNRVPTDSDKSLARTGLLQYAIDQVRVTSSANAINTTGNGFLQRFFPAMSPINVGYDFPEVVTEVGAGFRGEGAPGYLTQVDLLNVIGNRLSVRSDTFLIRAYGSVVSPLTGEVTASAWCEALVQRVPDYVDPSNAPYDKTLSPLNQELGRRFIIIDFRWLSKNEI